MINSASYQLKQILIDPIQMQNNNIVKLPKHQNPSQCLH